MKIRGLIIFFTCLISSEVFAAPEGLRIAYDIEVAGLKQGSQAKMVGKYFIQNGAVRFETTLDNPLLGDTVVIGKTEPKQGYILFTKPKMYVEVPSLDRKEIQPNVPFQPSGKQKEIAGYKCKVITRDVEDRHEEACAAPDLSKELKTLEAALPSNGQGSSMIPKGLEGFPLEYEVFRKSADKKLEREIWMKAKELKKESMKTALFEIPEGYWKGALPGFNPQEAELTKKKGKEGEVLQPLKEELKTREKVKEKKRK